MIKIDPLAVFKTSPLQKVKKEASDEKSKKLSSSTPSKEASAAHHSPSISSLMALEELLFLQSTENQNISQVRTQERGNDLLKELEKLRLGLLTGDFSTQEMHHLSSIIHQKMTSADDPHLDKIVQEIEQRLAIEIAKREMA